MISAWNSLGVTCTRDGVIANSATESPSTTGSQAPVLLLRQLRTHIYPTAGTIFHKSTTSLKMWFYAIYLMASTRCGISAKQIQRETGVTYKTAWRMFHQIRTLFQKNLSTQGTVEMDETYYGGVRKHGTGRPMRGDKVKTPIVGVVERKGRAKALRM